MSVDDILELVVALFIIWYAYPMTYVILLCCETKSCYLILPFSVLGRNLNGVLEGNLALLVGTLNSAANKMKAVVWGEDTLYEYLLKPQEGIVTGCNVNDL